MIITQIIFTIFTYCCLNNLSEKRLKTRAIQNTVVLKIKIVMVYTPFVILPSLVLLPVRDNKFIDEQ